MRWGGFPFLCCASLRTVMLHLGEDRGGLDGPPVEAAVWFVGKSREAEGGEEEKQQKGCRGVAGNGWGRLKGSSECQVGE